MLNKEILEKMGLKLGGDAVITINPGGYLHYKNKDDEEIKITAGNTPIEITAND